jgi:hypothetical protein
MSSYGFIYSGSKSTFIESLAVNFPKAEHFYDLFGGGGSAVHYLSIKSKKFKHIHYNEIDPIVFDLFKKAINSDFNYSKFKPEWISREDFFNKKETDGYVKYIWSFSCNGQTYYCRSNIETYKKSMHLAIVFNEFDSLSTEVLGFNNWPSNIDTIYKKRIYLRQKIEHYRVTKIPKILHQFLNEKQLERLQQLERLTITANDYRDVGILYNAVVYCDIPYKNTEDYNKKLFDHDQFFEWAISRPFPVYISEYQISDNRFKLVYDIEKRSLLSGDKSQCKNKTEKLYWNGISL